MTEIFVYISTAIFAFLYMVWGKDTLINKFFTFLFLVMFLFGGLISLKIMGIIA